MRYFTEVSKYKTSYYGKRYACDHPLYDRCTLFTIGEKGLSVIQQRFDSKTKHTYWTEIDDWLSDKIYLHPNFKIYFDAHADHPENGLYPTRTIRQVMWAIRMKPLPKERWETVFDRKDI